MDRETAVKVIKEIFDFCRYVEGKSIQLMPPDANNVLSKGCQIHIQTNDDKILEDCLKTIAKSNILATAKEGEYLVIYKPH